MIVNGGDDGDVSRLPSPPFGICVFVQRFQIGNKSH